MHENELQMNPFVIAFIDKVKQNLVLDDNYHTVKLTEQRMRRFKIVRRSYSTIGKTIKCFIE